jgi:Zn-dependent oligopeptidase
MNLKDPIYSAENLSMTKTEMEGLLADPARRREAERLRQILPADAPPALTQTLDIIVRTCNCYDMSKSPEAQSIRDETGKLESKLEMSRNKMNLGYTMPDGTFVKASSVALRNLLRTSDDEATRKAAFEGLNSIGPFVIENGFVEIIKLRNKLAKQLGFIDYYDYKVTNAEGFGKERLFEIVDGLEKGSRPIQDKARKELAERYGEKALEPWNTSYMMAGSIVKEMDPYFPFAKSVERYARSYAAMKISYEGATMNLDLLDRDGKYSNGFCIWPRVAWTKPDGSWQPSVANFTSLADPSAVGSGLTALRTLFHEAGHAAHFANIRQPSPLFSQERAPTSVAYCENQSMFLDSLVSDAAWRAKYALSDNGKVLPFEIIEEEIRATHAFKVMGLRSMLSVSYYEKALYELPDEEVTLERLQSLAKEMEISIQGGLGARPLLSIPHLVSDEASCYYHGYTLAEMSVYQTRAFFLERDGYIVDNPSIGPTLTQAYWACGNSRPFLEIVKELTGKELSGSSWIDVLQVTVDDKVAQERKEYDIALAQKAAVTEGLDDVLNMKVRFVDGDEVIADSTQAGGILGACRVFESFVAKRVAATSG